MKVLTKYPVYVNKNKVSNADLYMNGDGATSAAKTVAGQQSVNAPKLPTDQEIKDKASIGQIWDKTKGKWRTMTQDEQSTFNKLRSSGVFSALGQFLGLGQRTSPTTDSLPLLPIEDESKKKEQKISTTTWVLIGVGVLALGGIIFFATRSEK